MLKQTQAGVFTDLTTGAGVTECFYMSSCACVQLASAQIRLEVLAMKNAGRIKEILIVCLTETFEIDALNRFLKVLMKRISYVLSCIRFPQSCRSISINILKIFFILLKVV